MNRMKRLERLIDNLPKYATNIGSGADCTDFLRLGVCPPARITSRIFIMRTIAIVSTGTYEFENEIIYIRLSRARLCISC